MKGRSNPGFSLAELLVVVTVIIILMSLLLVGMGETYILAERIKCQNRLEKLGHACQMWSNVNDGAELAALGRRTGRTVLWYRALVPYLSARGLVEEASRVLNCPNAEAGLDDAEEQEWGGGGGPDILFTYDRYKVWFDFIGIVEDLRAAGWRGVIHLLERHPVDQTGVFNPITDAINDYGIFTYIDAWYGKQFTSAELQAVKQFQQDSRSIFVSADHHTGFTQVNNQLADYCGWGLWNPGFVDRRNGAASVGTYQPVSDHPIGAGVTLFSGYNSEGRIEIPSNPAKQNPYADLVMFSSLHPGPPPDAIMGTMDDGKVRLVMETPWTKFASPRWYYDHPGCKESQFRYIQNIYNWLLERSAGGGEITYGYNNQVGAIDPQTGRPRPRPANPSEVIRILDYEDFIADHDGLPDAASDDPEHYIAPRHGGRANVLFMSGRIGALTPDQIRAGDWRLWRATR